MSTDHTIDPTLAIRDGDGNPVDLPLLSGHQYGCRPTEGRHAPGCVHVDEQRRQPAPYNPTDAEGCEACAVADDICPYHQGVNAGIQMAVRKLTRWAEGDED
ncbi:hypothetical protein [Actinokineospora sp.]|uniref:hypothetical protein n=1 Tax=Actinokineospora sp. TaxID=1872133 RepID=UPI003D6AAB0A